MNLRGVIFDMDGTITEPYFDFTKIRAEVNLGDRDLLDYLQEVRGDEHARLSAILCRFEEAGVTNARLNRGVREVLEYLAGRGLRTALLTRNSRRSLEAVCRKLCLEFDAVYSREDGPHKPAPEPIWEIARRWEVNPNEVLMVGDYKWDLYCAKNAGASCAILTNGAGVPEWAKEAEFIIHELGQLVGIIQENCLPRL